MATDDGLFDLPALCRAWEAARPVLIRQALPRELVAAVDLERTLASTPPPTRVSLTMLQDGERIARILPNPALLPATFQALRSRAQEYTCYLSGMERADGVYRAISEWARGPVDLLRSGFRVGVSPSGRECGIGFHADFFHAVLVQLAGVRRWDLWAPEHLPESYHDALVGRTDGTDIGAQLLAFGPPDPDRSYDLHPGDILYIPPLFGHASGRGTGEASSISVAIGWSALTPRRIGPALDRELPEEDPQMDDLLGPASPHLPVLDQLVDALRARYPELPADTGTRIEGFLRERCDLAAP